MKRRYLIQNPQEVVRYLATTSLPYKEAIDQIYLENYDHLTNRFALLSFRFKTFKQQEMVEADTHLFIVSDVSDDKRYSNRYLNHFGLPYRYDFSLKDLYRRCDKIGIQKLNFLILAGMSAQKVMRVLLYRELQFLEHYKRDFTHNHQSKALKKIVKCVANIVYLLDKSNVLFDASIEEALMRAFVIHACDTKSSAQAWISSHHYTTFLLNMRYFLFEESGFYLSLVSEMPMLFFVKKYLKKEECMVSKRLKSALFSNNFG